MPEFFGYPQMICEELDMMGIQVDYYDDRPSTSNWVKAAIRVKRSLLKTMIQRYADRILKETSRKQYDTVLVISGQSFSFDEEMFARLKAAQPQAEFVLYQWDSTRNFPHITNFYPYFDRMYTFDRQDAEADPKLNFLPLFYGRPFENIAR